MAASKTGHHAIVLRQSCETEFAGFLEKMIEKASTTTATLGIVWWYGTRQGAR
jgi:hypothetical protein